MVKIELNDLRKEFEQKQRNRIIKRGDIYWYDLGESTNSIQGGIRPIYIGSNDMCNKHSSILLGIPISTQINKCKLPTHVYIEANRNNGLSRDSFLMAEQIFPIDKTKLGDFIGYVEDKKIDKAIEISLGLKSVSTETQNIIYEKVKSIKELDFFIQQWIGKGRNLNTILEDIEERKIMIKDLKAYCENKGENIEKYYNLDYIKGENRKVGMVG